MGKDNRPPKHSRTLKRGDVREDGMIFWCYRKVCKNGENWITPETFDARKRKEMDYQREHTCDNRPPKHLRILRNGDVREDGMIFWCYSPRSKNGERWVAPDKFKEMQSRASELASSRQKANRKNINLWRRCRVGSDAGLRITNNLRTRIVKALSGSPKSSTSLDLFGCTREELVKHLETQFQSGMTWNNYGLYGWHVDHIKPCASFDLTLDEEQRKCFHYTNLQPLWAKDNLSKGARNVEQKAF